MTSFIDELRPSPWRSVWLAPADTIARILALRPTYHVVLLAVLAPLAPAILQFHEQGWTFAFLDWRIDVILVVLCLLYAATLLFVSAPLYALSGWLFGGYSSVREMRAVLAWSLTPFVLCLSVLVALLVSMRWLDDDLSRVLFGILEGFVIVAALWSTVMMLIMLARVQQFRFWRALVSGALGLFLASLLLPLVVALLIRTFLFQPFTVPAASMMPTLMVGDYFFASKFSYGYSRFSLPFSPHWFSGKILASPPQRGDVVVFRLPKDTSADYVKRVVGMPGERIQMIDGVLHINGTPVKRERLDDFVDSSGDHKMRIKRWRETLPNGITYETLDLRDNGFLDNTQIYAVPPNHYFMLGDHRDNSTDSRVLSQVGYVPAENIYARARMVFMSIDRAHRPPAPRGERLGTIIR